MKNFKRIVGLLLCLAMVLSFVPVTHTHVHAASYQKIDLGGYIAYGGSYKTDSGKDYKERTWDKSSIGALTDNDVSAGFDIRLWETLSADCYLDLTQKSDKAVVADQLKIYYVGFRKTIEDHDARSNIPSLTIFLTLEDGSVVIKRFDELDWNGIENDLLTWSFDESYSIESIYVWSEETPSDAFTHFSLAELELYRDTSRPEPVEYEKIDLTGTVKGACSQSASGTDYADYKWYSDPADKANWASWKTAVVDGDRSTTMQYSVGDTERADYYLDLSDNSDGYTTVDKLVMYHGGIYAVPQVDIVLVLDGGAVKEKSFTTSDWGTSANGSTISWVLEETCNVKGVYVNEPNNEKASHGDIMLFRNVNADPPVVEPEDPTDPPVAGELGTTTVGAGYIDVPLSSSNLYGACSQGGAAKNVSTSTNFKDITWWFLPSGGSGRFERIQGLVDGVTIPTSTNDTTGGFTQWSGGSGEGGDFYLDMGSTGVTIDEIRLYSYKYKDNANYITPKKIKVILVLKSGTPVEKTFDTGWKEDVASGTACQLNLGQTYNVTGVYVMSITNTYDLGDTKYFSLAEVELYKKTQLPQPENLQVIGDPTSNSFTVGANTVSAGGMLQFRVLDSEGNTVVDWQDANESSNNISNNSYTFTGRTANTAYTIQARYKATDGYISTQEANYARITVTTAKQKLDMPTGFAATKVTDNSITVTANTNANGILFFRLCQGKNWGDWTKAEDDGSYTFKGLTGRTEYLIHAIYYPVDNNEYQMSDFDGINVTTPPSSPEKIGFSYSIHLIEPWALRTKITFATEEGTPIKHAGVKSYGAYAITADKFDGSTVEDLIADDDTEVYAMNDLAAADDTTVYFDFYDGLYTYRMNEEIRTVVYWEDAEGTKHYSDIQTISLAGVIQKIEEQGHAPDSELAVLNNMKSLHKALIAFRGQDAQLGNVYPEGVAVNAEDFSGKDTKTYKFGKTKQIRLIEPWGFRITVRYGTGSENVGALSNASDYGMIFYYDTKGQFTDGMTADQIIAADGAQVFSNKNNNLEVNGNYFIAVFDDGIYTYQLNSNLYCLPFVKIGNQMYCQENATVYNPYTMLTGEVGKYQAGNSSRDEKEIAVFNAMISLYKNVNTYRNPPVM